MKKEPFGRVIILVSLLYLGIFLASAVPEGGQISREGSTRHTADAVVVMSGGRAAMAGNVTYLNITANAVSRTWAAYYGNVSGTMLLETAGGNAMYSWAMASPGGKVIATNESITDWTSIQCWNYSTATANGLRWTEWNEKYNVTDNDYDAVNNTFAGDYNYSIFNIGSVRFNPLTEHGKAENSPELCPGMQLFNESGAVGVNAHRHQYEQIILQEGDWVAANNNPPLLYVALIEPNGLGFDGNQVDFQLIVPDNGHGSDTDSTTFNFYIELEAGEYS